MTILAMHTLSYTLPRHDVIGTNCVESFWPLLDLHSVIALGQQRDSKRLDTLRIKRTPLKGGIPDTMTVSDSGKVYTVWLVTRDTSGNVSCASNLLTIGGDLVGVGSPPSRVPASEPPVVKYFDVQGRRVHPPLRGGVYWVQTGLARPKRIVVIR